MTQQVKKMVLNLPKQDTENQAWLVADLKDNELRAAMAPTISVREEITAAGDSVFYPTLEWNAIILDDEVNDVG